MQEAEDGGRGWSHPLVALQDGCRYRWAVVHHLSLEHIQIPPILHCLGALFTASLCTALKLMLKMRVCLKIIYHLIITLMQAARGTSASARLCLLLLMWGIAGKGCWGNWKKAKPLANDLVVAVRRKRMRRRMRRMRGDLCTRAPLPSSLPLLPAALWSRDSQIKVFIYIMRKIILPSPGVPGFARGQWAAASAHA